MAKYKDIERKALEKLAEENEQRRANGRPERVLVGSSVINEYFPGTEHPPRPELYWYTPKEMAQAFLNQRKAAASGPPKASGLGIQNRKAREKFSFNVVQFVPVAGPNQKDRERFEQLTNLLHGEYRSLPGLEAIKSYMDSGKDK